MSYRLGVDLGTTWTAAATWEAGKAAIFPLGQQRAAIPSVVLLREDGTVLTGDAALRRAISEPERVAREFKRRIGDTTPIIVAGAPYPAEALTARLLRSVIDQVATQQGRPPEQVVISHPANWGPYKLELLTDIARRADLDLTECAFITEPEAAATSYASRERVGVGQNVCVFDLGGGTFDVAVLQRTPTGFAILGRPDGIERLGGIDFDAAIYAHVTSLLGAHYQDLDPGDALTLSAIARLRQDCVEAKEALSADTDTTIPVLLPQYQTEFRLTRSEFETLIRPPLQDAIETTRRAIASANLDTGDIHHVLLVGGSSRIPLISQMVQRDLDLPTAVDADPKHAIATGAAILRLPPLSPNEVAASMAANAPATASPAPAPHHPVADRTPDPFEVRSPAGPPPLPHIDPPIPGPGPQPSVAAAARGLAPSGGGPEIEQDDPFVDAPSSGRVAAARPSGGASGQAPISQAPISQAPSGPAPHRPPPAPAPIPAANPIPVIDAGRTTRAPALNQPPPKTPGPARAQRAVPADLSAVGPPPGSEAAPSAFSPPAFAPAPAGAPAPAFSPPPPASLTSFTPPAVPPAQARREARPDVAHPPPPPGGAGAAPSSQPRTPRPAPPPAHLPDRAGPGRPPDGGRPAPLDLPPSRVGSQPLISSKAGTVPAAEARLRRDGPEPAPLPVQAISEGGRSGRTTLAIVIVLVLIMLGVGAYLLATM